MLRLAPHSLKSKKHCRGVASYAPAGKLDDKNVGC